MGSGNWNRPAQRADVRGTRLALRLQLASVCRTSRAELSQLAACHTAELCGLQAPGPSTAALALLKERHHQGRPASRGPAPYL